jgi:Ring finger domain/Ankyrin repeats (3 copies)
MADPMDVDANPMDVEKGNLMCSKEEGPPTPPATVTCGICIEPLKSPTTTLSCGHQYCSECFEGWKSKYHLRDLPAERGCPQCRKKIPLTKDFFSLLELRRKLLADVKKVLDNPPYRIPPPHVDTGCGNIKDRHLASLLPHGCLPRIRSYPSWETQQLAMKRMYNFNMEVFTRGIQELEDMIGDRNPSDLSEVSGGVQFEKLPDEMVRAVALGEVERVLGWLGDPPVSPGRINARASYMDTTLLHLALIEKNVELVKLLLQLGAEVDPQTTLGQTPFYLACTNKTDVLFEIAKVLLEWGANKETKTNSSIIVPILQAVRRYGDAKRAALLESPLGGRRCKIVGLKQRLDLNGSTCIVGKYLGKAIDRYEVLVESTKEAARVRSANLNRLDRTPSNPGYVLTYMGRDSDTRSPVYSTSGMAQSCTTNQATGLWCKATTTDKGVVADESEDGATTKCGICFQAVKTPNVTVPTCGHQFCVNCFSGWRSKYDLTLSKNRCPKCGAKIPPTQEMLEMLRNFRGERALLQVLLDRPPYRLPPLSALCGNDASTTDVLVARAIELGRGDLSRLHSIPIFEAQQGVIKLRLEFKIKELTKEIEAMEKGFDAPNGDPKDVLVQMDGTENFPEEIKLLHDCTIETVAPVILRWLDDSSASSARINNARGECGITLLHAAGHFDDEFLVSILLQRGAKVEAKNAFGISPLFYACRSPKGFDVAKVLLQWGAHTDHRHVKLATENDNIELAFLLDTPLGGRRCELVGLKGRLNGMTGVVGRYFQKMDRYEFTLEATKEGIKIRSCYLKRRDRTPSDPGTIVEYLGRDSKTGKNRYTASNVAEPGS